MNATLGLLGVQGLLGAFDTLYFHEWRARLPARPEATTELRLHAARSAIYAIVFCTIPWMAWLGNIAWILAVLLAVEVVITFADFVVEDRVRIGLGGVYPGERVMHGLMAIVYGAFMAGLLPQLVEWTGGSGPSLGEGAPLAILAALTALGIGSALSGIRDFLAACGVEAAAWPWAPRLVDARPVVAARLRHATTLAIAIIALVALIPSKPR